LPVTNPKSPGTKSCCAIDLGMRLGEGTGGALAMSIMEGALKVFKEVLTLDEAGVAEKNQ
jgi:nicotinate-nucleotide--dimethylbenzimidazole phosphoribosyltransferase